MNEAPETKIELPPNLKFLRVLVTVLTTTMILGLLVLIGLFVTRFPTINPVSQSEVGALPDRITLPAGAHATAFTQGSDWYAVVTDQDQILIFERADQTLRQTITLESK
jgi:hypothetical protein